LAADHRVSEPETYFFNSVLANKRLAGHEVKVLKLGSDDRFGRSGDILLFPGILAFRAPHGVKKKNCTSAEGFRLFMEPSAYTAAM